MAQNFLQLKSNWGWLFALGILFIILGIIGLSMSLRLTLVSIVFFGILVIIAGISHIICAFKYKNIRESIWQGFIAILYIIAGCLIIYDPLLASMIITAILAAVFAIIGIIRIALACGTGSNKGTGRFWLFLAGLAGLFLAFIIFAQWPLSALWFIGLWIAIELLIAGWSYIILAFSLRKAI